MIKASWPEIDASYQSDAIESQFANFQKSLGAVRDIRAKQKGIDNKRKINFGIKCSADIADSLKPMGPYYSRMALAELTDIGPDVESPAVSANMVRDDLEIFVDLDGLIDKQAEKARLEKEKAQVIKNIGGKKGKLSSDKFVNGAPAEIVQRERDGLAKLEHQLDKIEASLKALGA